MVWEVFTGLGDTLMNLAMVLVSIFIFAIFIGVGVWWIFKFKRYSEYEVRIWEKDSFGQWHETKDSAGVFLKKKTGNQLFFLKKSKVGLSPDKVPFIKRGNRKVVYLRKDGLKNYRYIKLNIPDGEHIEIKVGEEDVNWAIDALKQAEKTFNENMLLQYMPYIIVAFTLIVIVIIILPFIKNISVLKDVAIAFKEAAQALAAANAGTVVIPGG